MTKKMLEILGNRQRVGVWMKKNMMKVAMAAMVAFSCGFFAADNAYASHGNDYTGAVYMNADTKTVGTDTKVVFGTTSLTLHRAETGTNYYLDASSYRIENGKYYIDAYVSKTDKTVAKTYELTDVTAWTNMKSATVGKGPDYSSTDRYNWLEVSTSTADSSFSTGIVNNVYNDMKAHIEQDSNIVVTGKGTETSPYKIKAVDTHATKITDSKQGYDNANNKEYSNTYTLYRSKVKVDGQGNPVVGEDGKIQYEEVSFGTVVDTHNRVASLALEGDASLKITNKDGDTATADLSGLKTTQSKANETKITNLDGRVTTNTNNITNLDGRVTTNTNNITNLAKGYEFGADDASAKVAVGKTVKVVGDATGTEAGNIKTAFTKDSDGNAQIKVALNSDIKVDNVTVNKNIKLGDTVINKNEQGGINITNTTTNTSTTINGDSITTKEIKLGNKTINQTFVTEVEELDDRAVKYDKKADGSIDKTKVTLEGGQNGTTITNVRAGEVSATSTDAVNGSQLYATNVKLGDYSESKNYNYINKNNSAITNIEILDGKLGEVAEGYTFGADDASAKVAVGKTVKVVGDAEGEEEGNITTAFTKDNDGNAQIKVALNDDIKVDNITVNENIQLGATTTNNITINKDGITVIKKAGDNTYTTTIEGDKITTNQIKLGDKIINKTFVEDVEELDDRAVKYDKNEDGTINKTTVTLEGEDGTTITNVKAGEVSSTSTDAVNGSQLYATNIKLGDYSEGKTYNYINKNNSAIRNIEILDQSIKTVADGYEFGADDASAKVAVGKTVKVVGDATATAAGNIATTFTKDADGNAQIKVALNDDIKVDNITVNKNIKLGDNVINNNTEGGINITNTTNNTSTTINGDTITTNEINATTINLGDNKVINKEFVTKVENLDNRAVKYDVNEDGTVNYTKVTLGGGEGGTTVTNVKAGEVSATSTDAINGSQLYEVKQLAGKHTTVEGDDNVKVAKTEKDGQLHYDLSLNKDLNLGANGSLTTGSTSINNNGLNFTSTNAAGVKTITNVTVNNAGDIYLNKGTKEQPVAVKITNVAAGEISATSTDAVNGSQLDATNTYIKNHEEQWAKDTNTTYKFDPEKEVLVDLDGEVIEVVTGINIMSSDAKDPVATISAGANVSFDYDKEKNTYYINASGGGIDPYIGGGITGEHGVEVEQLDGGTVVKAKVDNKTIVINDKDEIALGKGAADNKTIEINENNQIALKKEIKDQIDNNTKNINNIRQDVNRMDNKINRLDNKVNKVGAHAAALAGIHYQDMRPGESQIGVGVGSYKGERATALGLAYQANNRVMVQASAAAGAGEYMANLGVSYKFGQHSVRKDVVEKQDPATMTLAQAETLAMVESLKFNNKNQAEEIAQLKADKAAQDDRIAKLEAMVAQLASK